MTYIALEARTRSLTFSALEARAHVQRAPVRKSRGAKKFIAAKRGDQTDAPERPKYTSTRHNRSIVVEFHQKMQTPKNANGALPCLPRSGSKLAFKGFATVGPLGRALG